MLPVAHGNDGGGSMRIPAACCGLVGLKPSRGRISRGPDLGDSFLACDGVLTRTVGETAALLDVLAGYEVGDATWAPRARRALLDLRAPRPGPAARRDDAPKTLWAPTSTRIACAGCTRPPSCSPGSATRSTRRRRRCRARTRCALFTGAFGPAIALQQSPTASCSPAAPPEEDEIEPLSRAIFEPVARDVGWSSTSPASRSCRRWRAASWRSSPSTTCCSRRRWPSAR